MNQLNVVGPDRVDNAAMHRAVDGRDGELGRSVLGLEKAIPYRLPPPRGGASRLHLSIKRPIHPLSEHTPQRDKIRMGN